MIAVETERTAQGYPRVTWVQQLVKEAQGTRLRRQAIIWAIVIGTLIGGSAGASKPDLGVVGGIFGGIIICLIIALGAFGNSMKNPSQREWADKPVVVDSPAYAQLEGTPGALMFSWGFQTPKGEVVGDAVPLDSFDTFEFGTLDEWFSGPDDRKGFGDCYGIVLHAKEGTKCVAAHAGSKADMSRLHATLTSLFVDNRPVLQPRVRRPPASSNAPPRRDDDVPKSL